MKAMDSKGMELLGLKHYSLCSVTFLTFIWNVYGSEDSGIDISNISNRRNVHNSTSSELPGEETTTVLSSTIGKKAQDLIERINQSRAMDQEIMTTFENKLMNKVSLSYYWVKSTWS